MVSNIKNVMISFGYFSVIGCFGCDGIYFLKVLFSPSLKNIYVYIFFSYL